MCLVATWSGSFIRRQVSMEFWFHTGSILIPYWFHTILYYTFATDQRKRIPWVLCYDATQVCQKEILYLETDLALAWFVKLTSGEKFLFKQQMVQTEANEDGNKAKNTYKCASCQKTPDRECVNERASDILVYCQRLALFLDALVPL